MTETASKRHPGIWGEQMQIWLDSESYEGSDSHLVSRFWKSPSNDVSEVLIEEPSDQDEAFSLIGMVPWILVRCSDWTMVPLENLVAASRGTETRIVAAIEKAIELSGAAFALGEGVDALLVPTNLVGDAIEFLGDRWTKEENSQTNTAKSVEARIVSIEGAGVGERVCVDMTRRISDGQGLAVGSLSGKMCLLHGETISSEYVPTRPFRVNAGAIHSYVLMADGRTKYLSELESGDEVAILTAFGLQGNGTIGRLKIESRPLLLVKFALSGGDEGQVVVQQAETVRFVTPEGGAISVTEAKEGDAISVITDNRARHIGIALNGEMVEK